MAKRRQGATRNSGEVEPKVNLRWLLPLTLSIAGLSLIYFGAVYLLEPTTLPVRTVRIESPLTHVTQQQLRELISAHVQQGFLKLDMDAIQHDVEALPWVYQASVRRSWPDKLVVRIEEQQAVARWGGKGLVNRHGDVFQPQDVADWSQLPLLRGPEGTEATVVKQYQEVLEMLTPLGLKVSHLTMNERRAWSLRLSNGLQVVLGRNETHMRLLRFVRVYADVLMPRLKAIDSVDLRYTNGFAVRWHDGHAPATV